MNRRDFLKMAGLGSAAVAMGSMTYRISSWFTQGPGAEWEVLSDDEAEIIGSIADALFPGSPDGMPNGVEAGLVEYFDDYLTGVNAKSRNFLLGMARAVDDVAVMADLRLRRFHRRPREERIGILRAWDQSALMLRRQGFSALKYTLATGYCNTVAFRRAAGINFTCGGMA